MGTFPSSHSVKNKLRKRKPSVQEAPTWNVYLKVKVTNPVYCLLS